MTQSALSRMDNRNGFARAVGKWQSDRKTLAPAAPELQSMVRPGIGGRTRRDSRTRKKEGH
eukprot:6424431-Heterocapsa_arctica.AAC.1